MFLPQKQESHTALAQEISWFGSAGRSLRPPFNSSPAIDDPGRELQVVLRLLKQSRMQIVRLHNANVKVTAKRPIDPASRPYRCRGAPRSGSDAVKTSGSAEKDMGGIGKPSPGVNVLRTQKDGPHIQMRGVIPRGFSDSPEIAS